MSNHEFHNRISTDRYTSEFNMEELFPVMPEQEKQQAVVLGTKPRLHWFQWLTYIIVCITCVAVCVAIWDVYQVIIAVHEAAQRFTTELGK